MTRQAECTFGDGAQAQAAAATNAGARSNRDWWPNQIKLGILHQHAPASNQMDDGFDNA